MRLGSDQVGGFLTTSGRARAPWRATVLAAAGAMVVAVASSAEAEPMSAGNLVDIGAQLEVALKGRIVQRCEIQGGESIDLGELRGGLVAAAGFGLDCNVPFDINVSSARGGLAHASQPQGEGPFAGMLPYDLKVTVPTRYPEREVVVEGRFFSPDMMARAVLSSGDGIASGRGWLELRTRAPSGAGLLAGRYRETLTMTISPRV